MRGAEELLATLKRHGWDRRMPADFEGITRFTELPRIEVQTDQTCLLIENLPFAQHTKWWYHEDNSVEGVVDDGYVCWALRSAILRCAKDAVLDMAAQAEEAPC